MPRTALIFGVANQRSLAWASTLSLLRNGVVDRAIVTAKSERQADGVQKLVESSFSSSSSSDELPVQVGVCDVSCAESKASFFDDALPKFLDGDSVGCMVHSIAYAPVEAMKCNEGELGLLNLSSDAFRVAHDVSAYSLIELSRRSLTHMARPGSIVTLSYLGAQRAVPNYNVMGPAKASLEALVRGLAMELGDSNHNIRVNCVSSGPVNTLAARGIRDFASMKADVLERAPLRRNVTSEEVGNAVSFLSSDLSSGITGQTIYVDCGYGMIAGMRS